MVYSESQEIDLERVELRGGFLLKTLVLSIDPFLRGQMRDENIPSYMVIISSSSVSLKLRHDNLSRHLFWVNRKSLIRTHSVNLSDF